MQSFYQNPKECGRDQKISVFYADTSLFESKIMLEAFKKGNYFKEIEVENQFKYLFIKPHNIDRTIIIKVGGIL